MEETQRERDRRICREVEEELAKRTPEQVKADNARIEAIMKKHGFNSIEELLGIDKR